MTPGGTTTLNHRATPPHERVLGVRAHAGPAAMFLAVAAEAAWRLQQQVPGLTIAGAYAGSPDPRADEETVARVRMAAPDVLLVAYGSPHQEFWIARNKERLGVPMSMGVGGTLDYLAGRQRRAPALLQRLWLDWAFRLAMQPWRWRRMLAIPRFIWAVLRTA